MLKVFGWLGLIFIFGNGQMLYASSSYGQLSRGSILGKHKDDITGHIGGLSNELVSGVSDVKGNRYNFDLNFDYHRKAPYEYEKRLTLNLLQNDQNALLYSINEAYIGNQWGRSEIYVGRYILDWSKIDQAWGFGKVNNRQNFDFFEPNQEGLIGVTFKRKYHSGIRYELFTSFLYVPELNPPMEIDKENGTITSKSPWSNAPAETARIESRDVPINYNVDYPSVSEAVLRYSAGLKFGFETKHFDFNAFYMRKPENQFTPIVTFSYNSGDDEAKAFIDPQFYYHDLYGTNLNYNNKDLNIYFSAIAVRPNTFPDGSIEATQYTQIETEKRREDYLGGGISLENDKRAIGAGYVARLSPFDREDDILAQDPRWNQAVNTFFRYRFSREFQISGDGKYDTLTTDRLGQLKFSYLPARSMLLDLGVNVIGTSKDGKSYWSPYTNNDAVYARMRYVF